jgi:competence protein ComEC
MALRLDAQGRLPLVFAFGLCTGAAWYVIQWTEPLLHHLVIVLAVTLITYLRIIKRLVILPFLIAVCIFIIGAAGGALSGKLATLRVSHPVITQAMGPVMVEGWVEDVQPAKRGVRLRLNVHAIDGVETGALPRHLRVTHTTRLQVEAGRFVRCWAVLRPPPGPIIRGDYPFDRQAYYEGLGAVGYVQGRCRGGALGQPRRVIDKASLWVAKQRRQLAHYVDNVAGERAGGFAAALASGDRSFMAARDQDALRGAGLAHLLAISGLHMGIVGGLIYVMVWRALALIEPLALRISVRKPAAAAALLASLTYLIISGASVSTQRAFIMAAVFFGAILFDRAALSMRSLSIAMILVVLIAPWSVLTPGFQMSFAATGALIATYEAWQRQRRAAGQAASRGAMFWIKSLAVTSLVSSLATMPFALYHFDRIAGLGLIANLLAMPIISLISAPLAGFAMVLAPFGLSAWPLRLFGYSLEGVLWVAHTFTNLAPEGTGSGKPMPPLALLALTSALVFACVLRGWQKRVVAGVVLTAIGAALWLASPGAGLHWAPSGDVYVVQSSGAVERIGFVKGDGLAPLRYVDAPKDEVCEAPVCLKQVGPQTIAMVAAPDALDCRTVENVSIILAAKLFDETSLCGVPIIQWSNAEASNGLSWQLSANTLHQTKKPPCGERPWSPCKR